MRPKSTILLVDDEPDIRNSYAQALDLAGFGVRSFAAAENVLDLLGHEFDGAIIADIRLPKMDGMTLLGRVREIDPEIPVVLVTGHADLPFAVRAMREGAYDFLEKPASAQLLTTVAGRATDFRRLVIENRHLRRTIGGPDTIETRLAGRSARIEDVRYQILAIAQTDTDVLIVGDTGTGKGVAARALHDFSRRATHPFVIVDCAALSPELIESELFGHAAGAFPGAARTRFGKFDHARGGTVLLDEIGSASLELQAKLLRVIEDRTIMPLGMNEAVPIDARFVATSKVPLEAEAEAGRFRADLLYRLNGVTLRMPTLAERREDIPALFMQLVEDAAARHGRADIRVSQSVMSDATRRDWPGNIRELRNAANRFVLGLGGGSGIGPASETTRLSDRVADFERGVIAGALLASNGSLKDVYETLGISRKTLYEKMQKYGLERHEFIAEAAAKPSEEEI